MQVSQLHCPWHPSFAGASYRTRRPMESQKCQAWSIIQATIHDPAKFLISQGMAFYLLSLSNVGLECQNFVMVKRKISEAKHLKFKSSSVQSELEQCDG